VSGRLKILLPYRAFATANGIEIALPPAVLACGYPCEDNGLEAHGWYVVRTKARKENVAKLNLERRGVRVFLPRVREFGRRGGLRVAPLFPSYVFVNVSLVESYYRVAWTPGVRTFVSFGGTPTPVQAAVIAMLRYAGGTDEVIQPGIRLAPGDRVQIKYGPFAGLVAIIERPCSARGRVQVLLDFLRRGARVEIAAGLVERI
jgi:transcription elongation factor/antiterminator RfaH